MKTRGAIAALLLMTPAATFAANKDMEALQRDVALMSEDIRTLQRSFDQQMAAMKALVQQAVDNTTRINTSVGVVQQTLPDQIKQQMSSSMAPVAGVNTRLDQVSQQVQTLSDAIQALNQNLQQIHGQLTDLKNVVSAMQAPAAPPPSTDPNAPTAAGPQAMIGAPAPPLNTLYDNAYRDMGSGKIDLALSGFQNCVKYYPEEMQAASCQFYIGSIHASQGNFDQAVKDYDAVLEHFPNGPRTADAFYYKGLALVKMGRSRDARKEFVSVIQQYPKSAAADKARDQLKALGFSVPATSARKR